MKGWSHARKLFNVRSAAMMLVLFTGQLFPFAGAQSDVETADKLSRQAYKLGVEQKRYEEGIVLLKRAQALDPKEHWIPSTIGHFYMHMERYAEAEPYLEQSVKLAPPDTDEMEYVTYCLRKLERQKKLLAVGVPYLAAHGKEPATAKIWRYVAHAYAALGQFKESYDAHDHYFDFKSNDPDDWYAACLDFQDLKATQYLYPLYTEYAKRFPHDSGVAYVATMVRQATQLARSADSASRKDPFDELITYKDPQSPNVSKAFYGMVKEGLRSLPTHLWEPLAADGYKVMLTPFVIDVMNEGVEKCPRGYKPGSTHRNVPALFLSDKKYITVAEFYYDHDGKRKTNTEPAESVCHELGHALDVYHGSRLNTEKQEYYPHFSHSAAFTQAYLKDAALLSPTAKKDLAYYIQTDDRAGQEELFAELFPIIFDASGITGSNDELLARSFPATISLMAATLHVQWPPQKGGLKTPAPAKPRVDRRRTN